MPVWLGIALIVIIAIVALWLICFVFGLLFSGDFWEACQVATMMTAAFAGLFGIIAGIAWVIQVVLTASGLR